MAENSSRVQVTVAIIGMVGVLATGVLTNWDKLFPAKLPPDKTPVSQAPQRTPEPVDNVTNAEWRDVPGKDLGSPSDSDVGARFRAAHNYARKYGFAAAFPTFFDADYGQGVVYGTIFLTSNCAEWRDVPGGDLGGPSDTDVGARFRAVEAYAKRHGFGAGFPNFYQADSGDGTIYGTILLKRDCVEWRDIAAAELGNPSDSDIGARFRGVAAYAKPKGFFAGFPNFYSSNGTYGTILIKKKK
jgi:hypothetical protein